MKLPILLRGTTKINPPSEVRLISKLNLVTCGVKVILFLCPWGHAPDYGGGSKGTFYMNSPPPEPDF